MKVGGFYFEFHISYYQKYLIVLLELILIRINLPACESGGISFFYTKEIMNWSEKSKEIAEEILVKMEDCSSGSYTRDDMLRCLQKAAMSGMAFECDNWIKKRK